MSSRLDSVPLVSHISKQQTIRRFAGARHKTLSINIFLKILGKALILPATPRKQNHANEQHLS